MLIKSALLGGQAKDYLEDSLNLASCACQTNIRVQLPETAYTLHILEARGSHWRKPETQFSGIAADLRQSLRICGIPVEPRVDFRRVAPSRLLEPSSAYKYPCNCPEREQSSFLGVGADFRRDFSVV